MNKKSYKIIVNLFYQPVDELKKYLIEHNDVLIPILGGSITNPVKNDEWIKNNCLFDDVGENISDLNKNISREKCFSELVYAFLDGNLDDDYENLDSYLESNGFSND